LGIVEGGSNPGGAACEVWDVVVVKNRYTPPRGIPCVQATRHSGGCSFLEPVSRTPTLSEVKFERVGQRREVDRNPPTECSQGRKGQSSRRSSRKHMPAWRRGLSERPGRFRPAQRQGWEKLGRESKRCPKQCAAGFELQTWCPGGEGSST